MDKMVESGYQKAPLWGWEELAELPRAAVAELRDRFDQERGGFAGLTEEQEDGVLLFLLEYARRSGDDWLRGPWRR